jgi:potassium channel subfamily K
MITCLTIGFGDYTSITPAGRVVWIIYALMAVPIVTSFAVQTVTGIVSGSTAPCVMVPDTAALHLV